MKLQDQNHLQKIPCCKVRDYGFSMLQCDVKSNASASNAYNLLEGLFIDHRSGYPLTWRRWELLSNQVENQENELPESEIMMAHIEKDGFSVFTLHQKDLSPIENIKNKQTSLFTSLFSAKAQKSEQTGYKQVRVSQLRIPVGGEIPELTEAFTKALQLRSTEVWCRPVVVFVEKKTRLLWWAFFGFWITFQAKKQHPEPPCSNSSLVSQE